MTEGAAAYEAVHAEPDGDSTVDRMAARASECGYDGIVVRNHGDASPDYDPGDVAETHGIDVVDAVEVRAADRSRASGFVGSHRDRRTIVVVHGGSRAINRFAVEQPAVDVLAHPMGGDGNGTDGFDHVLARAAAENGVRVELSLAAVLRREGGRRVGAVRDLRTLRSLVERYDVPYVVSADPHSHLHVRAPRELGSLGEVVGLGADTVGRGLAAWGRLAERNRDRRSPSFVEPGVRICERSEGSESGTSERPESKRPDGSKRNPE